MIVLIDGYNVLKQIFPHVKGRLDLQRDAFVRQLGYYRNKKKKDIKEIIVVFDAGPFGHATREIHHGVVVMFSGQRSSADDWIVEYVEKHRNEDLMVVTMDRKIIDECEKLGATTLSSIDFYGIMQSFLLDESVQVLEAPKSEQIEKYKQEEEPLNHKIDRKALDLLMEQSSFFVNKQDDVNLRDKEGRRGKSSTLSKKARKLLSKVKKLG
jgi:predicted RNA-binding protein with PIN domain